MNEVLYNQLLEDNIVELNLKQMAKTAIATAAIGAGSFGAGYYKGLAQATPTVAQNATVRVSEPDTKPSVQSSTNVYTPELFDLIAKHEGYREQVYNDTRGFPTIGIGFNLNREDASKRLSKLGISLQDVLNGKRLTKSQITDLFIEDVEMAVEDARKFLSDFDSYPQNVKYVVIDMAFNMGYPTLSEFRKFKKALEERDYEKAIAEMKDSKWYKQTGNRPKELIDLMRNAK